ncbi:MAG: hypothetical protein ACI9WU_002856 [Myxococcota bacterium]|jgi:hypothetical protein
MSETEITLGTGYLVGLLARSLAAGKPKRARKFLAALHGMQRGTIEPGSRTPVADTPAWVTLDVVTGGFATGQFAAGGPIQPHEEALAQAHGLPPKETREALNAWHLTDAGMAQLSEQVARGTYRIDVPEEAALLTVCRLAELGDRDGARAVAAEIIPWFDRLRFFPRPHQRPLTAGTTLRLQTIRQALKAVQGVVVPRRIRQQQETLGVWTPLEDRSVALFAETVEDGWPCRRFAADWADRARGVVADYRRARKDHGLCRRPERPDGNFAQLCHFLNVASRDPALLTGREVGMIRHILSGIEAARGLPGSPRHRRIRAAQAQQLGATVSTAFIPVVVARCADLVPDEGVADTAPLLVPITDGEAARFALSAGEVLPAPIIRRLGRALEARLDQLVARDLIGSGEVLAVVAPQITAHVQASGIVDVSLRRLHGALYQAFGRRRSLLLLNLEHQVRLDELPWARATRALRAKSGSGKAAARDTLEQLTRLPLDAWPHAILPNRLLKELAALAKTARLPIPIVEEVAADIFMGRFSDTFLEAARIAGEQLQDSLYARYYGIDYDRVIKLADGEAFSALCYERVPEQPAGAPHSVAAEGMVIEQAQILTTHNLATLSAALAIEPTLDQAHRTLTWILTGLSRLESLTRHARLKTLKNAAYAWRQLVFILSRLSAVDSAQTTGFLAFAAEQLSKLDSGFADRFRPALDGLAAAARGGRPTQLFVGWTTTRHWLMPPPTETSALNT